MSKKYEAIVYICRAQPFHNGHFMLVHKALSMAKRVIICLGSSNQSRTATKDPFTFLERAEMIRQSFRESELDRISLIPLENYMYNNQQWIAQVNGKVEEYVQNYFPKDENPRVGIIGHHRDESSEYIDWFPKWEVIECDEVPVGLNATEIRHRYFTLNSAKEIGQLKLSVPVGTYDFLMELDKGIHNDLCEEYQYIMDYRKEWEVAPHPVIFTTTDCVVVYNGHILLVTRKDTPGKGLLALPGGFLKPDETLEVGALRELDEETKLRIPPAIQRSSIVNTKVFDHPGRSQRGRTITHAFFMLLRPNTAHNLGRDNMPIVKGSDDAAEEGTGWYLLNKLGDLRPRIFEDHSDIINYFVSTQTWSDRGIGI